MLNLKILEAQNKVIASQRTRWHQTAQRLQAQINTIRDDAERNAAIVEVYEKEIEQLQQEKKMFGEVVSQALDALKRGDEETAQHLLLQTGLLDEQG